MRYGLFFLVGVIFFGCSTNNVTQDPSLEKYFTENKVRGTFALMNNGTGQFTIYNLARYRDSAYLPASTFDIVNSLIGLQTGKIVNDSMVIKWDSIQRPVPAWNADLTMIKAFGLSSVPYYQEVSRRIGIDSIQKWLDSLSYGSKKITTKVDSFWLDNSLTITPDEQLGLIKNLYFNQLPFFNKYENKVKKAMMYEDKSTHRLTYKASMSGWDEKRKRQIGWILGWIEENQHPYFFTLNFETDDPAFDGATVPLKMLKELLKHLGFMEGRM